MAHCAPFPPVHAPFPLAAAVFLCGPPITDGSLFPLPPSSPAVVAELVERLGPAGAPLAGGLLQRVGELCAAAEDAEEEGGGARCVLCGIAS